ncbi:hypothetical protein GQ53DRAFT_461004 [Thozetella sp. PMI_491]|nr:hypothetical protein GQ53DRAFT_461004 [Thozetella sp. PMI_491]
MSSTSWAAPLSEALSHPQSRKPTRPDRPCDICRRRKSKCVKESAQDKCVLCTFHGLECTYLDGAQPRRKRGEPDGPGAPQQRSILRDQHPKRLKIVRAPSDDAGGLEHGAAAESGPSLLDRTLGLHRTMHFKYIGPSSVHEPRLLDLIHSPRYSRPAGRAEEAKFRRVDGTTTFVSRSDRQTFSTWEVDQELDMIEQLVEPHGPGLVDLYFRIIHPSYPILHKAVFLEKYARSYREFCPPLLAAVYLLAMDWWEYDRDLSARTKPDSGALLAAALKSMTGAIHRPKLSSAQAGLLLLQRSGGDSWVLTTQLVAVGEELGLHVDCSSWNIPEWEKGLRRRLAWAIFMQDKWGALIHGRPSHIIFPSWNLPVIALDDFPESAADDDDKEGSTEVEKGRLLFIQLTKLTRVMAHALDALYGPDQTKVHLLVATGGIQALLEVVKPLAVDLKDWASNLPPTLRMEDVKTRKLCSNGYLHLSYFVTEIILHRVIVRCLTSDTPEELRVLCREAGKARLEHAINFVDTLRPEHLQGFWWFASPKSLAFIRTFGGLLWATSETDEEAEFYRKRLEDFRWSLRVRAKGVGFVTAALQEMEENLQDLNMSRSPGAYRTPESQRLDTPSRSAETEGSYPYMGLDSDDIHLQGQQLDVAHADSVLSLLDMETPTLHGLVDNETEQALGYTDMEELQHPTLEY